MAADLPAGAFAAAGIGEGASRLVAGKRVCVALDLLGGAVWPRLPAPLLELARLIDDLRAALGGALGGGGGELVAELAAAA